MKVISGFLFIIFNDFYFVFNFDSFFVIFGGGIGDIIVDKRDKNICFYGGDILVGEKDNIMINI